jgi:acetyltransferase-like isoleucine patch superfamily enzyme
VRCYAGSLVEMVSIPTKTLKRLRRSWRRRGDVPARLKTTAIKLANRNVADQPVWIGRNGRLELEDGATMQLGGDLVIGELKRRHRKDKKKTGKGIPRTIGPAARTPAILRMFTNSHLETQGWVHMAPGTNIVIGPGATLRIEGSVFFSGGTVLCSGLIEIGEMTGIAWDSNISDSDMHPVVIDGEEMSKTDPISIGNHVWVGSGVRILKGVTIGDGAVLAAGSIVTKDVEPRTLVAGVPARVIRKNVDWR